MTRNRLIAALTVSAVVVLDQLTKFLVKLNMQIGEDIRVFGDWMRIHFVENNGMALGLEFAPGSIGKIALSLFRVVAVVVIGWYITQISKKKERPFYVICVSLIFAGAIGNIIDSLFYGVIFSSSIGQVAEFLPADGGYESFLHGRVVDMLYFPFINGTFPSWVPVWGGESYEFFRPVFNVADSAITVGIVLILLFFRDRLGADLNQQKQKSAGAETEGEAGAEQ